MLHTLYQQLEDNDYVDNDVDDDGHDDNWNNDAGY